MGLSPCRPDTVVIVDELCLQCGAILLFRLAHIPMKGTTAAAAQPANLSERCRSHCQLFQVASKTPIKSMFFETTSAAELSQYHGEVHRGLGYAAASRYPPRRNHRRAHDIFRCNAMRVLAWLWKRLRVDPPFISTLLKNGRNIMDHRLRPIRRRWLRDELRSRLRSPTNAR
jgi:hypothetical protein